MAPTVKAVLDEEAMIGEPKVSTTNVISTTSIRVVPPLDTNGSKDGTGASVDLTTLNPSASTDSESPQSQVPKADSFRRNRTRSTDPMEGGKVNYKSMNWWQAGIVMIAETISLGILSLPSCVAILGLAPGLFTIISTGMCAAYGGYVIGQFKLKYPEIVSMADAGERLFGKIGRLIFGVASSLMFICYMAAHILTFSICLNVLTGHGSCSLLYGFIAFVASVILTLPRTLKKVSYFSICSFLSIASAVMITMIGLGVNSEGGADIETVRREVGFYFVVLAVMDIVMAFAGNVAFFSVIAELADPRDFPKALALQQVVTNTIYCVVAGVIYYYGGSKTVSPALGATSPVVRKTAYIIAIPTILIAGVINAHIVAKYLYLQIGSRGTPPLYQQKSKRAWAVWLAIVATTWLLAWVIASAIPNFNQLLALVSALFGTWFTFGIPGMLWIHMNLELLKKPGQLLRNPLRYWKKLALLFVNVFLIILAAVLCVTGMYVSVKLLREEAGGPSFSCADNSL